MPDDSVWRYQISSTADGRPWTVDVSRSTVDSFITIKTILPFIVIYQLLKTNTMDVNFVGGVNIAIKIPKSKYEQTVTFYRDILKLPVEEKPITNPTVSRTHEVKFGPNTVWLDCVDNYTHSEVWLDLKTNDVDVATDYLLSKGINTVDELEEIPKDMHWIMDPAGTVLILNGA
jgi:hypothetical protein